MNDDYQGNKEYGCDDEPPIEKKIECPDSEPPCDESRHDSRNLIFGLTRDRFVELLFAFAITIFTGGMWWTSSDQVAEMKLQTASIEGQLVEMQKQSAGSLQAFKQQQRAYLAIGDDALVFVDGPPKPNRPIQVNIRYGNFGVSPATNIRVRKGIIIANDGIKKVKKLEIPENSPTSGLLPPGAHSIITTPEFPGFTAEQWAMFMRGDTIPNNIHIIAHGTISYEDIFFDRHETEFCFQYLTGGLWRYCPDRNHMK